MPTLKFFQQVTPAIFDAFGLTTYVDTPIHTPHTYKMDSHSPGVDSVILTSSSAHPFQYAKNGNVWVPTAGTVVSFEGDVNDAKFFTLTGISVAYNKLNTINFTTDLTIIGSPFDDTLGGGLHGKDVVKGGGGNDTILPGTANVTMTGGPGQDTFFFKTKFGNDVITDFTHDDTIKFNHSVFANFAAVKSHSHVEGGHIVIALNGHELAISTIHSKAELQTYHDDFLFV